MKRALAVVLLFCAAAANAAVPQRINYQGKLANIAGDPLTGVYSFRFKIFNVEGLGTALFTEDVTTAGNAISVVNGIYTVQIGSLTPGGIPYSVFDGSELYLEVDVQAGTTLSAPETLTPRERLNSAAWAVHALGAERLGTNAVISTHTAQGDLFIARNVMASSGMITGNYFSVGGSTFVATGGNVGIGTTAPATHLEVKNSNGGGIQVKSDDGALELASGDDMYSYIDFKGSANLASDYNGRFIFTDGPSGGFTFAANAANWLTSPQMLIRASGNVGIGTTTPAGLLDVSGSALFGAGAAKSTFSATPGGATFALMTSSGVSIATGPLVLNAGGFIRFTDGTSMVTAGAGGNFVARTGDNMSGQLSIGGSSLSVRSNAASSPLHVSTSPNPNVAALYVSSANMVAIGNVSPLARLHVSSSGAASSNTVLLVSSGTGIGQELLSVMGDGKVGIGVGAPGVALDVRGPGVNTAGVPVSAIIYDPSPFGTDVGAGLSLGGHTGGGFTQYAAIKGGKENATSANSAGYLALYSKVHASNLFERMRITSAGSVGIATGTPATMLDVNGSASFGNGALKSTFSATPSNTVYALSTSSGVNVGAGPVFLNTGGFIRFPDGSTMLSTATASGAFVTKTGDTMTGQLTVNGSSITIVNSVATSSFSFAVTTAPNRGIYHLYVATTGQVDMGGGVLTVGVSSFVVVGGGAAVGATNPAFIGASLTLQGRTFQVFNGAANAQVSIRAAANAAIWSESGNGMAGRRLFFQQHFGAGNQMIWRNASETTGATNQDNILVLTSTGGVGIGVQPQARLHVSSATTGTGDNIVLVSTTNGTTTTNLFRVQANGNVFAHGAMTGGGADLAEMYASEPDVEPGDVVEFSPQGRLRRAGDTSRRLAGIISSNPGTLLGWDIHRQEMPDHRPLALAGRVPVKFSSENGPAVRGDALTAAATPGYARRARPGELVIGSVLEDAGPGRVLAYVRSPDPHGQAELLELRQQNENLRRDLDELRRAVRGERKGTR